MNLTQLARTGALVACALTLTVAAVAQAASTPAHLRVVTAGGKTLADHIQYTGTTRFRASKKADCFGSPSSNKRYKLSGANALGLLVDGERLRRLLSPVEITDAFFADFGSMGVCGIGGKRAPFVPFDPDNPKPTPFWYLAHNQTGATVGANQLELSAGDEVLYYLTKGTEAGSPVQLDLRAPRKLDGAQPFKVRVFEYDPGTGKRSPAAGAEVNGNVTNAKGRATISPEDAGTLVLRATRDGDVPSAKERVCITAPKGGCKRVKGELILGSPRRDEISGTGRDDKIKPGRGKDKVNARAGNDKVVAKGGGRDVVNCGKGNKDVAKVDRKDVVRNCEKVVRV